MKITMYELLGLVKDGKAPKKIKYKNDIYEYEDYDYFGVNRGYFFDRYNVSKMLNEELEILEEEKKIPKKIEYHQVRRNEVEVDYIEDGIVKHFCLNKKQRYFADKINEIIDYLKSKGE